MKRQLLASMSYVLLAAMSGTAHAGLAINGGFETGDFYGWTVNDPSADTFVTSASVTPGYGPHSGDYFAAMGAIGQLGSISQNLNTTAGTTYTLDYFLASDGLTPNEFKVVWGGTTLFDQVNIPAQDYVEYTFQVTATGASTNLTFYEQNDNGFLSLDDVSVNAAAVVPEPTSMIPLGIGMATLIGYTSYRRRASADH